MADSMNRSPAADLSRCEPHPLLAMGGEVQTQDFRRRFLYASAPWPSGREGRQAANVPPQALRIDMFSQALKTQLVFALLLAMLVAWGGHSAAGLATARTSFAAPSELHVHGHEHDEPAAAACTLCQLQHEHSPLSADHLHETPYPSSLIKVHALVEHRQPAVAPRHFLPDSPVFLIERPPRPELVL